MYVLVKSGSAEYYALENLRIDYPHISFPEVITKEIAAEFNVYPCAVVVAPVVDHTKDLAVGPPEQVKGAWQQSWVISNASADEVAQRVQTQWEGVRADRNYRLSVSDWTQLPDAPVSSSVWAAYRQALRDITTQSDPFNIEWPLPPA